jgi:LacI family transcriptional regulator
MRSWKRDELRGRIEEMIRAGELWAKRLPSDRRLAEELGANRRTLQKALADLEAGGILERRHGSGTWVRPEGGACAPAGSARLAVICARHFEALYGWQYQAEMIHGALDQGRRLTADCSVLALDVEEERERIWQAGEMRGFSGFILISIDDGALVRHLLGLRRGPVVLVDRTVRGLPVTSVLDGAFEGMRAVTGHLLALGHRRIAFFHELGLARVSREKFDGYRSALLKAGLNTDDELLACPPEPRPLDEYSGEAVEELLTLPEPPTAVVASRDHRALALVAALESRGLHVGQDISVAGFGDTAIRIGLSDRLTSCRIYPRRFGAEAVRAALGPGGQSEGRTIIVPDRLMVRSSTRPPSSRGLTGLRSPGPEARTPAIGQGG